MRRNISGATLLAATLALFISATPSPAATEAASAADTTALLSMTPEELFIRASSAELQYADVLEPARRILVRRSDESVPYLVTRLDTDEPRERIALENLFVRIGAEAVPSLIEALGREARREDTTRGARLAAYVLARIKDPTAVTPLVGLQDHEGWKMRSSVADALGHLGGSASVDALVELAGDPDDSVRKAAVASLDRIAREDPGLVRDGAQGTLLEALDDRFYGVRYAASDALGRLGDAAVPHLENLVETAGARTRQMAVRSLGLIGGRDAARVVATHLNDTDWAVRAQAIESVMRAGTMSRSVQKKLRTLAESDEHPLVTARARAALAGQE